nr:GNAT family protein [Paracoccus amoyensis]
MAKDDPSPVAHIAVHPEQEPFCGTIAGHFAENEPACDFHQIQRGGVAVGFFKIDRAYHERYDFAGATDLGLRGVMIDASEQGRGTGTAAMAALRSYLSGSYPDFSAVYLTVNMVNPAAITAYRKAGFVDTGGIWPHGRMGPQHVMRMHLPG